MRKIFAIVCLSFFLTGVVGAVGLPPAHAQETKTDTAKTTSETESAAVQQARTQDCPEPKTLFPLKLSVPLGSVTEVSGLSEYINESYRFGVGIVLITAIVMVVWGGFRYLIGSSLGDVARGKEIIRDAIVGMLLVLGAYTILQVINPATTNLKVPALEGVGCVPLELTPAQRENNCISDANCGEGRKCVSTGFVFESRQADSEYFLFSEGAGVIRGLVSTVRGGSFTDGYIQQFGRTIRYCSDGKAGSPCGEDADCTEGGVSCIESWNLCSRETNLPPRAPCDGDHQCASGGDNCVGGNQSICRGNSRVLTIDDLRGVGYDLNRLDNSVKCATDEDCADAGGRCSGPAGHQVRFCVPGGAWEEGLIFDTYVPEEEKVHEGSPCFLGEHSITPAYCNGVGASIYTCTVCPRSGERNWEALNSTTDPERIRVGECKPRSVLKTTTRCAAGSRSLPEGPTGGYY